MAAHRQLENEIRIEIENLRRLPGEMQQLSTMRVR